MNDALHIVYFDFTGWAMISRKEVLRPLILRKKWTLGEISVLYSVILSHKKWPCQISKASFTKFVWSRSTSLRVVVAEDIFFASKDRIRKKIMSKTQGNFFLLSLLASQEVLFFYLLFSVQTIFCFSWAVMHVPMENFKEISTQSKLLVDSSATDIQQIHCCCLCQSLYDSSFLSTGYTRNHTATLLPISPLF